MNQNTTPATYLKLKNLRHLPLKLRTKMIVTCKIMNIVDTPSNLIPISTTNFSVKNCVRITRFVFIGVSIEKLIFVTLNKMKFKRASKIWIPFPVPKVVPVLRRPKTSQITSLILLIIKELCIHIKNMHHNENINNNSNIIDASKLKKLDVHFVSHVTNLTQAAGKNKIFQIEFFFLLNYVLFKKKNILCNNGMSKNDPKTLKIVKI